MLRKVQHWRQTSGHCWRDGARLLIDLRSTRHHVESSGRRTPRNRQSRFTPAAQVTLSWGNTHPWRLNASWHCTTRKRTSSKANAEEKTFFPDATSKETQWPTFCRWGWFTFSAMILAYFLAGDNTALHVAPQSPQPGPGGPVHRCSPPPPRWAVAGLASVRPHAEPAHKPADGRRGCP